MGWVAEADLIEEAEAGDVVVAQGEGLGQALVGVEAADDVDGVHDGPVRACWIGGRWGFR